MEREEIITSWQCGTLAELQDAVAGMVDDTAGQHPSTTYLLRTATLLLVERTLTDGSKVRDIALNLERAPR